MSPIKVGVDWAERAARLRQVRVDKGVSLSSVAGKLMITVTELGAIEAGNFQYFDSAQRVQGLLSKLEETLDPPMAVCGLFIPRFLRDDLSA
jgi:cytoskeletal protein RodZ